MCSLCRNALIALTAAATAVPFARADDAATRYYDGLRRRGLFQLAEGICLRQLARRELPSKERSDVTLEYSRTLAEHAKYKAGKEQAELWSRATKVIDDYLKDKPNAPRKKWLAVQRGVVLVLQGEFRRWDAELFPYDESHHREAAATLGRAIDAFQKLEQSLAGIGTPANRAGAGERALLLRHARYQRAIALINLAELHAAGSDKRAEPLLRATTALAPLASGPATSPITWNSRLLQAVVDRLAGRNREATGRLKSLEKKKPPSSVRHLIVVELMKNLLAKNLAAQADQILASLRKPRGRLPGELAYLKVKASIALWDTARKIGNANRAAELLKQARTDVAVAEGTVGGYWGYRCRVAFDFLKESRVYGRDLTVAMRRARALFADRKLKQAADQYAAAVRLASQKDHPQLAAKLAFTEGSLRLQSADYEGAARAFRRLVADHPKNARAAEADLMAAYSLGRLYDSRRTKARRLTYAQALDKHRRDFPRSSTRHEAAWMLAALHDYRRQTPEALKLYLAIPPAHSRGEAAQVAAARCYDEILARLRELKKPANVREWEIHAAAQLGRIVAGFPKPPAAWNQAQVDVALRTAGIHLNRSPSDYKTAASLLERILVSAKAARLRDQDAAARKFWTAVTNSARQQRIVALAGTGQFPQARALLAGLSQAGPAEVLAVLDGLMQVGTHTSAAVREQLGTLQLQTAQELDRKRDKLTPADRKWLDRCLAQAYSATGRADKAVEQYEALLAKSPRNKRLLRTVADLLLKSANRAQLVKAGKHWRTLESMAKPGSADWLNARYHIALSDYRLGDYDDCSKLLKVTQLLYPKLGGSELKPKFEKLIADVARRQTAP